MKNSMKILVIIFFCCGWLNAFAQKKQSLSSPDGRNMVEIEIGKIISYNVKRDGNQIIASSTISMETDKGTWGVNSKLSKVERKRVKEIVDFPVPRKYHQTENNYNSMMLSFKEFKIEFRAYDEGVAYRFVGTEKGIGEIRGETVEYTFDNNYQSYTLLTNRLENWYEENYTIAKLDELPQDQFSMAPVMVEVGKYKVLLAESDLTNYGGLYLQPSKRTFKGVFPYYPNQEEVQPGRNKIYTTKREDYIVKCDLNRTFPWRVAGIYDRATQIVESELIYQLSEARDSKIDYSWVRPGKALWDWWNDRNIYGVDFVSGINTATYMYMIDYISKHGLEYILIDEGWSDANDLLKLNPDVDIPAICKYAKEKGVDVLLWAKWINVDEQMEESFKWMNLHGVKGVKIDFMDRFDAKMVNFYHRTAEAAAKYKLMVNFHGSYPNEDMRRKYPNVMTREGLVGLEYNKMGQKDASVHHDLIIPYLRMWVGPMDYTPGAMLNAAKNYHFVRSGEPMSHGTRCHQLAMYVVYESPLQMMSDSPSKYDQNPQSRDFIVEVPSVWDETHVIAGEIGEYLVVARRKDSKWYLGAMNADSQRSIKVDLSFLNGNDWKMRAHKDGTNAHKNGMDFKYFEQQIPSDKQLNIHLAPGGGFVAVFEK